MSDGKKTGKDKKNKKKEKKDKSVSLSKSKSKCKSKSKSKTLMNKSKSSTSISSKKATTIDVKKRDNKSKKPKKEQKDQKSKKSVKPMSNSKKSQKASKPKPVVIQSTDESIELPDTVGKNQEQLDMIVSLLEQVRADHVTRVNKDDLDRIEILIKNIVYRENGEYVRVRQVTFTQQQKEFIKKLTGLDQDKAAAKEKKAKDKFMSRRRNFPLQKLSLVPTRASVYKK